MYASRERLPAHPAGSVSTILWATPGAAAFSSNLMPTAYPQMTEVLMFNLYQHKQYPEYRLITPHGSTLPMKSQMSGPWRYLSKAD
jgi:hypothetical protein